MKNKKNIFLKAGILLITILMILSSIDVMANTVKNNVQQTTATKDTTHIINPTKLVYENEISIISSIRGPICYGCNLHNDPSYNLVWFDATTPGTFNDIADIISSDFLSGGCFVADTWWVCVYSVDNSNIWKINKDTGTMTLVGPAGVGLNGLAYDPSGDTLYGCSGTDLFTISQTTGDSSPVGPFNTGGLMIGIACDINGKMYGEDLGTDSLYEINTGDGSALLIGSLGINLNYAQDIAYDKINDVLYSTGYKGSTNGGGALGTLDLFDGHYTFIGDFPIGANGCPSEVDALAIPYSGNSPPGNPVINGPTTGSPGVRLCWTFQSYDQDGDDVMFSIEWGDGTTTETECLPSGTEVEVCHTYSEQGTYIIKAKAKDCPGGLESGYTEYKVVIPRNKEIKRLFSNFLENHLNILSILRYFLSL